MPRNPNLRISLELKEGRWFFTLHRDGQAHHDFKGHPTPDIAASEAMVLNSILKIPTDSAERKQRYRMGVKNHGPTADDLNV